MRIAHLSDLHLTRGPLAAQPAAALVARFGDTAYLGNGVSPSYAVEYPQATLVLANSWVQGSPAGCLGPAQLAWIVSQAAAVRAF